MAYGKRPEYGKPRQERIRPEHLKPEETDRIAELYAWLHAHPLLEQHAGEIALGRTIITLKDILKQGREKNGYTTGQLKLLESIHATVGAYLHAGKAFYKERGTEYHAFLADLEEAIKTHKERDKDRFKGYPGWISQMSAEAAGKRTILPLHFGMKTLLERLKKSGADTEGLERRHKELSESYWETYNVHKPKRS